ncbi:chitinase [Streptomyces sp. NPDC002055]|uniref:chitinase n=1 Tax=Streptomyces sp. NPDC002055 TaxID=3154534 RepID=UPI00332A822A
MTSLPPQRPTGRRRKARHGTAAREPDTDGAISRRSTTGGLARGAWLAGGAVVIAGVIGGAAWALSGDGDTAAHRPPAANPAPTGRDDADPPSSAPSPREPKPVSVPFAPYVDTSLAASFDVTGAARTIGVKDYTLAFVGPSGRCTPAWGGSTPLGRDRVAAKLGDLRSADGDVRVSFGGQSGHELARSCPSVPKLVSAYSQVIDHYKLKRVDFDIENGALADDAGNDRRNRAIAALQKSHPGLDVSFTLPVLPRGLTPDGVSLLRNAKSHGVDIGAVNVMAMNYGASPAPDPDGRMGDYAIDAVENTHKALKGVLGTSDAETWRHIAVTPMIGVNDVKEEVFTVADAAKVARFARSKDMAWVSMWSASRDKACPGGSGGRAAATCSGVDQSANDFAKAFGSATR